MTASNHVPRFIPTLTEVVDPASLQNVVDRPQSDLQALVQQVQRDLQPMLERRLQEEFEQFQRTVLVEQWHAMRKRLQQDLDDMVRQAIAHGVTSADSGDGTTITSRVSTDS
ncbi:MAG: hypothetical protein AUJ20_10290 [Comamonadaceae bacterium CG1_02_60_18]|nr:MAG: hypothetical protein AUJ20_10290 [Comamonadaceae bacterium CG1_02_60_18]PIQ51422.1 MAG: hypothetical protein COW02_14910 [Comamonadaceae bacterium CG12_big_fil_rev_8_21_14_0_65_59_15]